MANPLSQASDPLQSLVRRLDAVISLLVEYDPSTRAPRSSYQQSVRLSKAGLAPHEIAVITGRYANNISRDLSNARKKGDLPKSTHGAEG